jgi:hypothetical protein
MATPSLQLGSGNWAVKSDSLLGYALPQGKYVPREMTFTRATTGTRVNAEGLVENVPYNLALWSEQFENAEWFTTGVVVSSNVEISPSGKLNADKLAPLSSNTIKSSNLIPISNNTTYTWSVYVKNAGARYVNFTAWTSDDPVTVYDLDLVLVVYESGPAHTSTIQDVGNGWRRITITRTSTSTSAWVLLRLLATPATPPTNGIDGTYVWGAQLVEGTQPLTYLPTTDRLDIPRIDYSTGSANLLLEPQRTNLCTYSQDFSNAAWNKVEDSGCSITITPNYTTASNGLPAARLVASRTNTSTLAALVNYLPNTGTSATKSIWMKNNNAGNVTIMFADEAVTITDSWERYSVTNTYLYSIVGLRYSGVALSCDISITGSQFELGSYPTSYIPTTSAAVTRNADSVSKTGISSLIGQQEGTVFIDVVVNGCQNISANLINTERNTTASFGIVYLKASSQIAAFVYYGGSYIGTSGASIAIGQRAKIAFAYKSGNTTLYVNGVQTATDTTTFTIPASLDDIFIGDPVTYFAYQESITNNATALFKTRLTNSELQSLTTL